MDLLLRKYSGFSIEKNPSDMGFFPRGSAGKESACSVGDLGSISGLGRSPGEVFWPGELHGQRSLAGYSPWGRKEYRVSLPRNRTYTNLWVC